MNTGPTSILAANYEWFDPDDQRAPKLGRFIQPVSVYNVRGIKVGVIGLGNVSSLNSSVEGDNSLGLRARDSKQAVSDLVRVLRPQVDLMVVVSHMGPDDDVAVSREVSENDSEVEQNDPNSAAVDLNGIDVVLGGHLHTVYYPPVDISHYDKDWHLPRPHHHRQQRCLCGSSSARSTWWFTSVIQLPLIRFNRRSFVKSYTFDIPVGERPWQPGDPTDPCDPSIRCDPPHPSNPEGDLPV